MSLTTNKGIDIIALGSTGWGTPINDNSTLIDKALGSFDTVSGTSGSITLTTAQYQNMCLKSDTAAFLADVTFVIPSTVAGQWVVINQSAASSFKLFIKNAASATSIDIPIGEVQTVYSDGTTVFLTAPTDPNPVSLQAFDSGTAATYTPTPGTRAILVTCVGGGGGGGAVDGQGVGTAAAAGGGGAGGRTQILITSLSASYTYTVGAGGNGAVAGTGTGATGGTTTFAGGATSLSADGGTGGQGRLASSSAVATNGGAGGAASGGGLLNFRGASGFAGQVTGDGTTASQGTGGSGVYGAGGAGDFVSGNTGGGVGSIATGYGAGGGGAAVAGQSTNYAGGNGSGGLIIVEEFA